MPTTTDETPLTPEEEQLRQSLNRRSSAQREAVTSLQQSLDEYHALVDRVLRETVGEAVKRTAIWTTIYDMLMAAYLVWRGGTSETLLVTLALYLWIHFAVWAYKRWIKPHPESSDAHQADA